MGKVERFGRRGFTLVELLVVLAIGMMLIAGMYALFSGQQRTYTAQDETAKMQQQARMAEELMLKTIMQAGSRAPVGNATLSFVPVLAASDHYLVLEFDDPNYADSPNVIGANEIICYALSNPTGATTENITFTADFDQNKNGKIEIPAERFAMTFPLAMHGPPYNLYRMTPDPANPTGAPLRELVAENVDNMVLRYYDNDGAPIPSISVTNKNVHPMPYRLTADEAADIRFMELELTMRSSRPDPAYSAAVVVSGALANSAATYNAAGTPQTSATFSDNYRRRTFVSKLTPRNLPADPCGTLSLSASPGSPKCANSSTISVLAYDRRGNPITNTKVIFTLPNFTNFTVKPTLGGAAVANTSVNISSSGTASISLGYTGKANNILVSAAVVNVDCRPSGPIDYTLSEAVSVNFLAADTASAIVFQTPPTYLPNATAELETCTNQYAEVGVRTFDNCGNEVSPPTNSAVSVDAPGGGTIANPTVTASGQIIRMVGGAPVAQVRTPPDGNWAETMRVATGSNASVNYYTSVGNFSNPDLFYAGKTGAYTPGGSAFDTFNVHAWPPSSIVPASIFNSVAIPGLIANDCSANTYVVASFDVKECNNLNIWNLNDPTRSTGARNIGVAINSSALGVINGSGVATPAASITLNGANGANPNKYEIDYTNTACYNGYSSAPGVANAVITATPSNSFAAAGSTVVELHGCQTCTLTASTPVSTCDGEGTVTLGTCVTAQYYLLTIDNSGTSGAYWLPSTGITPVAGNTKSAVLDRASTMMAAFSIGNASVGTQLAVQAQALTSSNPVSINPGGPICNSNPISVNNICSNPIHVWSNVDDPVSEGNSYCAATLKQLFVEINHCKISSSNAPMVIDPTLPYIEVWVYDQNGQIYDKEQVTLVSSTPTIINGTTYWRHTKFNNNVANSATTGPLEVTDSSNSVGNYYDRILSYPLGQNSSIHVKPWRDPVSPSNPCPAADYVFGLTPPLPICFPNAITSGGGGSWNGNFKIHWGDVVIRGTMAAPGGANKKVEKKQLASLQWPATFPTDQDMYADIYVGKSNTGIAGDGNIIGLSPTNGYTGVYRPYGPTAPSPDVFGNYFTNLTYPKISSMIMVLDYATMKREALTHSSNSYWVTIPGTTQLYNPSTRVTVTDIGALLQMLPSLGKNANNNGDYIFIDTYGAVNPAYAGNPTVEPHWISDSTQSSATIQAAADAGTLPSFSFSGGGGFYTQGIIYIAGSMRFGGLGGASAITATSPPQYDERYDHNRLTEFSEDELPIRPIINAVQITKTKSDPAALNVNINGAVYVVGTLDFQGQPSIYGALTAERGYGSGGTPEIWYNYDLNRTGNISSLCVECCDLTAKPTALTMGVNDTAQITPLNAHGSQISWNSTNPGVATVSTTGLVTAKAIGTAMIFLRDQSNCDFSVAVTVKRMCNSAAVVPPNVTINKSVSNTATLSLQNGDPSSTWSWSSDAPAVASVVGINNTATVTGLQCGVTTFPLITATDTSGYCTLGPYQSIITVTSNLALSAPITNVALSDTQTVTITGGSGTYTTSVSPVGAATINSATGNPNTFDVTFGATAGTVVVSVLDSSQSCAATLTFNVSCKAPSIVSMFPAIGSTTTWGLASTNGKYLPWAVEVNDNQANPLNFTQGDHVQFTVYNSAGSVVYNGADTTWAMNVTNTAAKDLCGFNGAVVNCASVTNSAQNDISTWADGTYNFTAQAFNIPMGTCGVMNSYIANSVVKIDNCALNNYNDDFTPAVLNTMWAKKWVGTAGTSSAISRFDLAGNGLLQLTARNNANVTNRYVFSYLDPALANPAFEVGNFAVELQVEGLSPPSGNNSGNRNAAAGIRIEDATGAAWVQITGMTTQQGTAGNRTEFASSGGTFVLAGGAQTDLTINTTSDTWFRIEKTGTTVVIKTKTSAAAAWTTYGTITNLTFNGQIKFGPVMELVARSGQDTSAYFDNVKMYCL